MASKFDTVRNKLTVSVSGDNHTGKSTLLLQILRFLQSKRAGVVIDMEPHLIAELECAEESMDTKFTQHESIDYSAYDIHFKEITDKSDRYAKSAAPTTSVGAFAPAMQAFEKQYNEIIPQTTTSFGVADGKHRLINGNYPFPVPAGLVCNTAVISTDPADSAGAHCDYEIKTFNPETAEETGVWPIHFQKGVVVDNAPNGFRVEDLLAICEDRLACFQAGKFACTENQMALDHVRAAKAALFGRALDRLNRNVLNTHEK